MLATYFELIKTFHRETDHKTPFDTSVTNEGGLSGGW